MARAAEPGARRGRPAERVRVLTVHTPQGRAGTLAKDSVHVFTSDPGVLHAQADDRAVSLTMPLRATPWQSTPMLPAFQTFLPEGFLRERIQERFDDDATHDRSLGFEDMVALQGRVNEQKYEGSYEGVALALRRNASPLHVHAFRRAFFGALVLCVALRNGDAHLKNSVCLSGQATGPSDHRRQSPGHWLVVGGMGAKPPGAWAAQSGLRVEREARTVGFASHHWGLGGRPPGVDPERAGMNRSAGAKSRRSYGRGEAVVA
jgi:HipA-like protein